MSRSETQVPSVKSLQQYLRQLSYDFSEINAPPVDGIAGELTRQALASFQALQSLPVTGTADLATWEALRLAYHHSLNNNAAPRQISVFPRTPRGFTLRSGSRGFAVSVLQHMLRELELYPASEEEQEDADGRYGAATEKGVRAFQSRALLPVTGETDLLTWNRLAQIYNVAFPNDT